jgi:hypothetical protein
MTRAAHVGVPCGLGLQGSATPTSQVERRLAEVREVSLHDPNRVQRNPPARVAEQGAPNEYRQ